MNTASARVSKGKKLIGLLAVFALTYLAPYMMYPLGPDVPRLMFYSPLFVLPACVAYFLLERFVTASGRARGTANTFARALVLWALAGAGMAFAGVIAVTAITNSGMGPLAFMFYGPAGLAIGGVAGTVMWRMSIVKPNPPLQAGPAASGRPLS
jgi:hypothetical protein